MRKLFNKLATRFVFLKKCMAEDLLTFAHDVRKQVVPTLLMYLLLRKADASSRDLLPEPRAMQQQLAV